VPNVGRGLLDHVTLLIKRPLAKARGLNHRYRGLGFVRSILEYGLFRKGPLASGIWEVCAFGRSDPNLALPDFQLLMGGTTMGERQMMFGKSVASTERTPGLTVCSMLNNMSSEGEVSLRAPDASVPPRLFMPWFATDEDQRSAIGTFRFIRALMAQPALSAIVGPELDEVAAARSDAEILRYYRRFSTAGLRAIRSCRMGTDGSSVVDPELRVRHVEGLRIADCSVMPGHVSGNTNGPAMALAWHAADLILQAA
jgi:choline dehydrogenase-like flavoprotein